MNHHNFNWNPEAASAADEYLWQAFRYVAGELSSEDAEAFEDRMLEDPQLCLAVAQATQLTCDVAAISSLQVDRRREDLPPRPLEPSDPERNAHPTAGRIHWGAFATLCSLCCLAVLSIAVSTTNHSTSRIETETVDWIADHDESNSEAEAGLLVGAWSAAADSVDDFDAFETSETDLDVPSWMLAAVNLSDSEISDGAEGIPLGTGSAGAELF